MTGSEPQVVCVVTRLELRHVWFAPLLWLTYRRVRRSITSPAPLAALMVAESPRTYLTISIWEQPLDIIGSATSEHVHAVRLSRRICRAIWSAQWHMTKLSPGSRSWPATAGAWVQLAMQTGAEHSIPNALTYCEGRIVRGSQRT